MAFSNFLDSNIAQTIFSPTFLKIATGIGYIYIASKITNFVILLLDLFLLRGEDLRKYGKRGSWAVITGASSDLGKEYALQLAAKGFNTLLISSTESNLQTLAREIESQHADIRTKSLVIDFTQNSDADYAKLKAMVNGLDIAILINNVDRSHSIPVPFILAPEDETQDIITINCMATLRVTRIIAPGIVLRHRGLILTMGCFDGLSPTPLLGAYSGSKAFLQHWSSALGAELKPEGVEVQLALSYNIASAIPKNRKSSTVIPTPRVFVETVLRKIGRAGGGQSMSWTMTPHWTHALMQWGLENLPTGSSEILVGMKMTFNEKIRKMALKKMEREGKKID